MPYWQLFYHLVWSTKGRVPLLTPEVEPIVYELLRHKAIGLGGTVFALNGVADHVHLVATIPPRIAVATFIGRVKATAATRFNKSNASLGSLFWQDGYGAFSFDAKRLPNVVAYVTQQKEHHAQNRMISILERCDPNEPHVLHDAPSEYGPDDEWRREMLAMDAPDANDGTKPDSSGAAM